MSEIIEDLNNPEHYTADGLEVIDVIEAFDLNFNLGNVLKYVLRSERKGCPLRDLKKAKWYLDRQVVSTEQMEQPQRLSASWTVTAQDFQRDGDKTMRCVTLRRHKLELERKLAEITQVMDEMGCER